MKIFIKLLTELIKRKSLIGLTLLLFTASFSLGQVHNKSAVPLKIEHRLNIDGILNEPEWEKAVKYGDFIQFQPERGQPSSFITQVRILYDEENIYFGFYCFDPEQDKIAARLTKRDSDLKPDDSVYIMLDTFHDKRNCYYVATNPLGTQWDGRITDNGRSDDSTWDGIWRTAAAFTEYGWSAEFAISLNSLKYEPGFKKTWGLQLGRGIPRFLEFSFWTGPLESPYKVSQFGALRDLDLAKAQKKAQIIPHMITKFEEERDSDFSAGVDARYAFSQMVSGNLTINPDFATVEADQEQINLTRFELNLTEKRNFFLEGSEIYNQRIRLFYSRRISDIYGGAKIYGKSGGYEFSGLTAQTKNEALDPLGEDSANFSVIRIKKDILKSSNLGFILANRFTNGKNMGTVGLDTSLYFTDTLSYTGQFALSYGDFDQKNIAFFLRPSYDSATFHFHLRYTHLGEKFADNANSVGFIRDDNRHEFDSAVNKTFWIKRGYFERIEYDSNYNIYWGTDGTLRSWQIDEELSLDFMNKISFAVEHHQEFKLYEKKFRNHSSEFLLGYNTREWQSAEINYSFGRNFDLDFRLIEGGFNYKFSEDLSVSYLVTRLIFNPDPESESTWIHVIRSTNYFTKDIFLKLFYQLNSSIDKKNIQLLFVYRFQPPFGLFQIAYQRGTAEFGERGDQGHTLFIKLAYMF